MNDSYSELLKDLNFMIAALKDEVLMAAMKDEPSMFHLDLPSDSWTASVVIIDNTLNVEIWKNATLLAKHERWDLSDPVIWLWLFVPHISMVVAAHKSILPSNMKVIVTIKSESSELRASCSASELVKAILSGEIYKFAPLMTMLDLDFVKYE